MRTATSPAPRNEISTPFVSEQAGLSAESRMRSPKRVQDDVETLLEHFTTQLFYREANGYTGKFNTQRSVDILGQEQSVGAMVVAMGVYINLCGISLYERVNKRVASKTTLTAAFNFPALQLAGALKHPDVSQGIAQVMDMIDADKTGKVMSEFLLSFAHILVGLRENGRENNVDGFTGAKKVLPRNMRVADKVTLVHLLLAENARLCQNKQTKRR